MKRSNTVPSSSTIRKDSNSVSGDSEPKGRYKSVLPTPQQRSLPSSTLSPEFLHSFGFASRPHQSDSSEPEMVSSQAPTKMDIEEMSSDSKSLGLLSSNAISSGYSSSTSCSNKGPLHQKDHNFLSESRLNVMSHNLSEIADRVSPTKYDTSLDLDNLSEVLLRRTEIQSESSTSNSNISRSKTPYARKSSDSKSYASRQKSFTRRGKRDHGTANQEKNNGEFDVDAGLNHISLHDMEPFKLDAETDSGYSSALSTSVSLSEDAETLKRLSMENGSNTDVDELFNSTGECLSEMKLGEWGAPLPQQKIDENFTQPGSLSSQKTSDLEERLDTLIHGMSSGVKDLSVEKRNTAEKDMPNNNLLEHNTVAKSESFKIVPENAHMEQNLSTSPDFAKSPFQLTKGKEPADEKTAGKTKTGRKPGILRRRTTLVSFRPPKQMTVQEGESDIVEIDEAGFMQLLTDIKSLKTQLLKLKRELQEADVVSPLSHPHSQLARRPSAPFANDPSLGRMNAPYGKKMFLKRTMTMDAAAMQERLFEGHSFSFAAASSEDNASTEVNERLLKCEGKEKRLAEVLSTKDTSTKQDNEEAKGVSGAELEEMKKQLQEISQERDSLVIQREELEHELDSKNHTIRMLQKQLEAQDNRDEMAYLKRQVGSLTDQVQQQQHKITELRYRTASPGSVAMGTVSTTFQQKKDLVKADIRNRLRDAFVRHLGESSKNHIQLSKHIQKAEQNITMAQKGLRSLCSSPPVHLHHASTENLTEDKSGTVFQRLSSVSSIDRNQDDSDGTDSESQSSISAGRRSMSPTFHRRQRETDGSASESDSGKVTRRWLTTPRSERGRGDSDETDSETRSGKSRRWSGSSQDGGKRDDDGSASESDSIRVIRRWLRTPSFERNKEDQEKCDSDAASTRHTKSPTSIGAKDKHGRYESDSVSTKPNGVRTASSTPRVRKLSRSKGASNALDTPSLSHSWTPGAIEKIVKSWRETKSSESEENSTEQEEGLKPVGHVQFL